MLIKLAGEGVAVRDNTAGERVDEEADEITIEEIVIDSIIDKIAGGEAVLDNTAGAVVAISDKIAGDGAVLDNTAGGVVAISNKAGERDEAIRVAIERS